MSVIYGGSYQQVVFGCAFIVMCFEPFLHFNCGPESFGRGQKIGHYGITDGFYNDSLMFADYGEKHVIQFLDHYSAGEITMLFIKGSGAFHVGKQNSYFLSRFFWFF